MTEEEWAKVVSTKEHNDGFTKAHHAAMSQSLPKDFDHWLIKSKNGSTVAHTAAVAGYRFPKEFPHWHVFNQDLYTPITVAYIAAIFHTLPEDFDGWDEPALKDYNGNVLKTVREAFNFNS